MQLLMQETNSVSNWAKPELPRKAGGCLMLKVMPEALLPEAPTAPARRNTAST
jgi:hypothetical protein